MTQIVEPNSRESEESVLGAMMISRSSAGIACEMLKASDFYYEPNRVIFEAASANYVHGDPTDPVVIADQLEREKKLAEAGDRAYVYSLLSTCPNPENVRHYASQVLEASLSRAVIRAGYDITQIGYDTSRPSEVRIAEAESVAYEVGRRMRNETVAPIAPAVTESLERMVDAIDTGDTVSGYRSPWTELDEITGGFNRGEMVVVGARSSMGKTAFILDVLLAAALRGKTVLLFSLEMSRRELAARLLCNLARVSLWRFKNAPHQFTGSDLERLNSAKKLLGGCRFLVDDKADRSLHEIASIARRRTREAEAIVAIDYIQLMYGSGRAESRTQEVAKLANEIKVMARELDCPVLVTSQLRKKAIGAKPEPTLEDLKESSAIEQACDIGILLYRPEVDNPDDPGTYGVAEIQVAKNRNGRTGRTELRWFGEWTSFRSVADEYDD